MKSKVTVDIMYGKEYTSTGKITSPKLVAQHLRAIFCTTSGTFCCFSMQSDNVMFFLSFSWCTEALCETVVHLLVQGMLACARSRTRIEVLRSKSRGARLYAYQADLLDRRPICCHNIIRDSGSRHEGCRDCVEETTKDQTWEVGMRTGSRAWVIEGGDTRASWTQLATEVWEGCWKR